eukprot:c15299_g1_i1.p1 GENE.c15299_g1_i1~~c15299_g1_i1.p1  ORF type:complete len:135 (-),score=32.51 c15299_g1_i1:268-672(-)
MADSKETQIRNYCEVKQIKHLVSSILSAITRERPNDIREFTLYFLKRPVIKSRPLSMRGDRQLLELTRQIRDEKTVETMVEAQVAKEEDKEVLKRMQKQKSTKLFEHKGSEHKGPDEDAPPPIVLDHAPIILDD